MNRHTHKSFTPLQTLLLIGTAVFLFLLGTIAALSAASTQAQERSPNLINYQGYLTNDAGEPLDGTATLTLGIYDAPTGGNLLWSEVQLNVLVSDGYFSVMLGSVTPLSGATFSEPNRYLQVGVDSGGGMVSLPRQQFTAVPYALQAANAWSLNGNSGTDPLTHRFGTTDEASLTFVVSDTAVMRFDPAYTPTGDFAPNITGNPFSNFIQSDLLGVIIAGGVNNVITSTTAGNHSTISGGSNNLVTGSNSTIGGGLDNKATGSLATIAGGKSNIASEFYATIGGGVDNQAGFLAVVGGGSENQAVSYGTVGGGLFNGATYQYATVAGGRGNNASGRFSSVSGGGGNIAGGEYAAIGGGAGNEATGDRSYAIGTRAHAEHNGAFVWSDSSAVDFISTGNDQFLIEADGGMGVGTNAPATQLHVVATLDAVANIDGHVVAIENDATTDFDGPDLLALKLTNISDPESGSNFITFVDQDSGVGAIEGNGSGGVTYKTSGADFAEYLPLTDPSEPIAIGTVVGLSDGYISQQTSGADRVFAISSAAGFVGNAVGDDAQAGSALVALMGQVDVQVRGTVQAGDYVVASGLNDGVGVGVPLAELRAEQVGQVVGLALESTADGGQVLVLVGVPHDTIWQAMLQARDAQLANLELRLAQLEQLLLDDTACSTNCP